MISLGKFSTVSNRKYDVNKNNTIRNRRAYETVMDHLENPDFMLSTTKRHPFKDHYRRDFDGASKRQKRSSSNPKSWKQRKQFMRYEFNTHK